MPRIGRVVVPNMPHHVVQRGHNRNVVFVSKEDYRYYLDTLSIWKDIFEVRVYAWCLMTNHVHFILDPGDAIESIGLLMKRLAGRQTRYVNCREARSGSLWDGRYKMSIVDTDEYLLQCCRYIDLNPVKAGMTRSPGDYPWSGYREIAGIVPDKIVDRSALFSLTGLSGNEYQEYCKQGAIASENAFISERLESNRLTGSNKFIDEIERRTGVRLEYAKPGRPRKVNK